MENGVIKYVTERETSKMTCFAIPTLRNHRFLGRGIPYIRCGRSIRYSVKDIIEYMEKHKIKTQE